MRSDKNPETDLILERIPEGAEALRLWVQSKADPQQAKPRRIDSRGRQAINRHVRTRVGRELAAGPIGMP